ncbi:hypothetical protein QFC22_003421 [Naganishia vaughanmartiniae]|uniref:Uncharacterized protein n=1 Tax=Naganishia vaughanmartiniae TaxID=1424756 RepID=A0ACC2X9G7_9TREE|nr:hypothetical protein QFC22_003421 [Naganishia vaughanmartiniae]
MTLASDEVAPKDAQPKSPSQKPKKRGSSFFAKVRSVFKDFDQAKPAPIQNRDSDLLHVSTTDPPISPPHSPTACSHAERSHAELGLFAFEKGKPLEPDYSRLVGERANEFLSLTPSNSSADNSKSDTAKHSKNSATNAVTRRIHSSSSSTLGESAHGSPKMSDQTRMELSSDAIRQLSVSSTPPGDALNIRDLKLSSSSSDSDREGVHIALANYLSGLCKDGTLSSSLALRDFFATRQSDLEHQSNKQRNLASRSTGIIASEEEQHEDSPPNAFDAETSLTANSLPRRIRSAENGITGSSFPADIETSKTPYISPADNRQVPANVPVSHLGFDSGVIERPSSCGQQEGGSKGLDMPTLPEDGANGRVGVSSKPTARRPLTVDDFDLIRTLGKGCAGKVSPTNKIGECV